MRMFHPHFRDKKSDLGKLKLLPQITPRLSGRADSSLDLSNFKTDAQFAGGGGLGGADAFRCFLKLPLSC